MEKWQMEACVRVVHNDLVALKDGAEEYQEKALANMDAYCASEVVGALRSFTSALKVNIDKLSQIIG